MRTFAPPTPDIGSRLSQPVAPEYPIEAFQRNVPPPLLRIVKKLCATAPPATAVSCCGVVSTTKSGDTTSQLPTIGQSEGGSVATKRGSGSVTDATTTDEVGARKTLEVVSVNSRLPSGGNPRNV